MKTPLLMCGNVVRKTVLLLALVAAPALGAQVQTLPRPELPTDPVQRRTARAMHQWIETLKPSEAGELYSKGKLVFSWQELTASYPEQARILDDCEEDRRVRLVYANKRHSRPVTARIAVHHAPDSVTIRLYGTEAYKVALESTNGIHYFDFTVPRQWPVESQEQQAENDRQASLEAQKDVARATAPVSPEADVQERVTKIIFPEVNWQKVAPADCVKWLADESQRVDPDGDGVSFVVTSPADTTNTGKLVTLHLQNARLIDIIKQVASQSGWSYQIDSDVVKFY